MKKRKTAQGTILALKRENEDLAARLTAANREVMRMHGQVMEARERARQGGEELSQIAFGVYAGAALAFGTDCGGGEREVTLPLIAPQSQEAYDLRVCRDAEAQTLTVRVRPREGGK